MRKSLFTITFLLFGMISVFGAKDISVPFNSKIKIDGNTKDWASVKVAKAALGDTKGLNVKNLKFACDKTYLYIYFETSKELLKEANTLKEDITYFTLFVDSDNDKETGNKKQGTTQAGHEYQIMFRTGRKNVDYKIQKLLSSSSNVLAVSGGQQNSKSDYFKVKGKTVELKISLAKLKLSLNSTVIIRSVETASNKGSGGYEKFTVKLPKLVISEEKKGKTVSNVSKIVLVLVMLLLMMVLVGSIAKKAGMSMALGIVFPIGLFVLAFSQWPVEKTIAKLNRELDEYDDYE